MGNHLRNFDCFEILNFLDGARPSFLPTTMPRVIRKPRFGEKVPAGSLAGGGGFDRLKISSFPATFSPEAPCHFATVAASGLQG